MKPLTVPVGVVFSCGGLSFIFIYFHAEHLPKLALISLVLGIMYSAVTGMEMFGIVAAITVCIQTTPTSA
jgi:uncharacterized protein YybS (DUF2232 family)